MVAVGLVGCGTIGAGLARAIERKHRHAARIVALHDRDRTQALRVQRQLRESPPICSLPSLIRRSQLIIEAASVEAAARVVPLALRARRSVLVMSVGGLLRNRSWQRLARATPTPHGRGGWDLRPRVYIPSGALAGLDGVKAMAVGRIRGAWLTTRKPPQALAEAPYVRRKGLNLVGRRRAVVIWSGSARSVIEAFPQNTNVAATLALASGSDRRVRVRVVADPTLRTNVHELEVRGDRGRLLCRVESEPSRTNPKTSEQALRSAVAMLDEIFGPVIIGT